ncbi:MULTISPECIES: helix-turn-helix domain-containing protein [Staphylococcus]|uniref:helix-turn-helix domain-containing protein n=1 Tax=Staphylococcus TaxID=1279 RepID=UPI000A62E33E|nr:helix-turn-helix transcriptional regulator [Staphylococcus aureus]MEC6083929.1 helix-turn-helix transcriptional regulator [Staphylococcus aureus]CAC7012151.1 DNA-binding transcriptional repressor PuuR [Staphylococcus aureus]HCU9716198.1 helix-turn-helix transcriptional regulator [Staphylococcus aureus]HCX2553861.1 helix-turn-helix transcriptional regulator [Staphylococcus aureus]HCX3011899.1 helix-turn-helix transcriptional regulator [Staphylococcus aureus]
MRGIGKILQDERKTRNLKQQKVADDLGIARAHLSKIENAKREHTSISTLIRLSDYYNMKLSEVIEKAKLYSDYI